MKIGNNIVSSHQNTNDYLNTWLQSWNFKGNPFHLWEAHRELHIEEYYIKHKFYEQLLASKNPTMVFAFRGEGKTATRIMIQKDCLPHKKTSKTLAIPFSDFSSLIESNYLRNKKITFQDYLPLLIQEGLISLLCVCALLLRDNISISKKELAHIKFWITSYSPSLLDENNLDFLIKEIWKRSSRIEIDNSRIDFWRKILSSKTTEPSLFIQSIKNPFWESFFNLWISLKNIRPLSLGNWNIQGVSSKLVMQDFVRFIRDTIAKGKIQCEEIVFLFDGIDEYDETRGSPDASAEILSPLLWEMWFHRIDGLVNKFFLPMEHKSKFITANTRWDLFEIFDLDWHGSNEQSIEPDAMTRLLRERINFFNSEGKNTLNHLCEPEIGRFIEEELIAESDKSPRNLIRLGNILFTEHCEIEPEPKSLITLTEWENAVRKYRSSIYLARREENFVNSNSNDVKRVITQHPKLIIKQAARKVFRGDEEIILSSTEFDLLLELNRRVGQICSEDELITSIYKQNYSKKLSDSLRSHIRHLREKIEPKGQKTYIYIKNIRGRGYTLENVE